MNHFQNKVQLTTLNHDDFRNYVQFLAVSIVQNSEPPTDRHYYHLNRFNSQRRQVIEQILLLLRQSNARLLPIFESCVQHIHLQIVMMTCSQQDSVVPRPSICDITGESVHHARQCIFKDLHGASVIKTFTIRSDFVNMIRWWHVYVHFGTFIQVKLFDILQNVSQWHHCVVEHIPDKFYGDLWESILFLHSQNQSLLQPLHTTVGHLTYNQDVCL